MPNDFVDLHSENMFRLKLTVKFFSLSFLMFNVLNSNIETAAYVKKYFFPVLKTYGLMSRTTVVPTQTDQILVSKASHGCFYSFSGIITVMMNVLGLGKLTVVALTSTVTVLYR